MNEAAWHPDPTGRHELRWWDGTEWTDNVSDQGVAGNDPLAPPAQPVVATPQPQWGAPATPFTPTPSGPPPIIEQVPGPDTQVYIPSTEPTSAYPPVADPTNMYPPAVDPGMYAPAADPTAGYAPVAPVYGSTMLGGEMPPAKKNRLPLIIGAVVALAGLGVAAFFLLKGDDEKSTTLGGDTTAVVTQPTIDITVPQIDITTPPVTDGVDTTSAPDTTGAPDTTEPAPAGVSEALIAALQTATDAPAEWTPATGEVPIAKPNDSNDFCNGPNDVARAQTFGSIGEAWGPAYGTPPGGRITVDAYAFPTEQDAANYLQATGGQVNACPAPTTYTIDESRIDALPDPLGDTATWQFTEHALAAFVESPDADEVLTITSDDNGTVNVDGTEYTFIFTYQYLYERHGKVVLVSILNGLHDFTGQANPAWAYNPQPADVAAAAAALRPSILARLQSAGLL